MMLSLFAASALALGLANNPCTTVDHGHKSFSKLLKTYVNNGHVDYQGWKAKDQKTLDTYLGTLQGVCTKDYDGFSKAQQKAYWINSYNAHTVALILANHGVASIRDIHKDKGGPWDEVWIPTKLYGKSSLSLNAIEHDILRKKFTDARLHFVLVCAAVSCPPLRNSAYTAKRLDADLDARTKLFLNNPRRNFYDSEKNVLKLSQLFNWYGDDFGGKGDAEKIAAYVGRYMKGAERWKANSPSLAYLDYDWALNGK